MKIDEQFVDINAKFYTTKNNFIKHEFSLLKLLKFKNHIGT